MEVAIRGVYSAGSPRNMNFPSFETIFFYLIVIYDLGFCSIPIEFRVNIGLYGKGDVIGYVHLHHELLKSQVRFCSFIDVYVYHESRIGVDVRGPFNLPAVGDLPNYLCLFLTDLEGPIRGKVLHSKDCRFCSKIGISGEIINGLDTKVRACRYCKLAMCEGEDRLIGCKIDMGPIIHNQCPLINGKIKGILGSRKLYGSRDGTIYCNILIIVSFEGLV